MTLKEMLGDAFKEGMTVEEITAALAKMEAPKPAGDDEKYAKLKAAFDKTASEAADFKRKLRESQTEEERRASEDKEARDKIQSDYNELLRRVQVSDHTSRFLSLGYDKALATETATALVAGDLDKVFANQQKALDAHEQKLKEKLLNETPKPPAGAGTDPTSHQKAADAALASGDMSLAAYHLRQAQSEGGGQ